jgi:hypothetical protein
MTYTIWNEGSTKLTIDIMWFKCDNQYILSLLLFIILLQDTNFSHALLQSTQLAEENRQLRNQVISLL